MDGTVTVPFAWVPQYVCDFPSYVHMAHRLDSTKLLVAELHDAYNFAHYYNRTQSDTIVISAIEAHSFAKHVDGEHTIYDKQ